MEQLYWGKNPPIDRLASVFERHEVVVCSSDTVLGLFALITKKGKERLDVLKQRFNKPYLVMVGSVNKLLNLVDEQELLHIENLIKNCWPGPLTIILKVKSDVPVWMKAENGTIAIRMPDHEGLQKILDRVPGLFSTSANISGQPLPASINEIDDALLEQIDFMVVNQEEKKEDKPSTILDCTGEQVRLIREGAYPLKQLEEVLGDVILHS